MLTKTSYALFQSDTASVKVPELDLELASGTLGGLVTTVEGLITKVSGSKYYLRPLLSISCFNSTSCRFPLHSFYSSFCFLVLGHDMFLKIDCRHFLTFEDDIGLPNSLISSI